jgi:hypothetical protein
MASPSMHPSGARSDVLRRLLLAKSILSSGRATSAAQPNDHLVAKHVLSAHDAADLAFAAILDQQGKLTPTGNSFMMQNLELLDTKAEKHIGYFKGLNAARNALKHSGVLPNIAYWANVAMDVFEKLSGICQATLGIPLAELDESDLITSDKARAHLTAAKTARTSQDFKLALEEIGKALFISLEDAPDVGAIQVGRARAEDALKLTAFGIPANDFLRLQEFLPVVSGWPTEALRLEPSEVSWKQSEFGHPGNWREDVADFCVSTYLNVALSIQNASSIPYAREFPFLYEYRVTAKEDQVEVWEDLIDEEKHLAEVYSNDTRPFRTHNRFLRKGESVTVSAHVRPFVSDDLTLSRDAIKRVRISDDRMRAICGLASADDRAEFVNLADVNITCVPNSLCRDWSPPLPEIPWEDDPLTFGM